MSLRVAAASSLADHALGGLAATGAILAGDYLGLIDLGDDVGFIVVWIAFASAVIWILLAVYLWHLQGGRGRLDRPRRQGFSFDDEVFNEALLESETLRRNVVGVALDEETREAALDESPTFAAEYLEEEARS